VRTPADPKEWKRPSNWPSEAEIHDRKEDAKLYNFKRKVKPEQKSSKKLAVKGPLKKQLADKAVKEENSESESD